MFDWLKKTKPVTNAKGSIVVQNVKEQSTVIVQTGDTHIHPPGQAEAIVPPDLYHLPKPTTALIGRKTELAQLTEAFTSSNKRLAIIVAAGGIGKSALTDEWLQQMAEHNYYGKTRVFGWSFYSQGSHNTFTNSQPFFSAVLPYLGVREIPKDEIEKARVLARECQKQPCLLILDGLEPLQYAENLPSMNGELQDSALKEFILQFRRAAGQSFILLSSRQPLVELKKWQEERFLSLPLATLPHSDGAKLLAKLGVQGNETERRAISQNLNGHALSLVLMGHLLVEHHAGDPRYANELPPLTSAYGDSDAEQDSRHALRVLEYYDSLQDEASRCFLQLLGLFDRPMNADEQQELIAKADHAAPLRVLTDAEWRKLEQRLENNGLLLGKKGRFRYFEWDTHPIIRAFFCEYFKKNYTENFKQAHLVLFCHYKKLPDKYQPDTLEEMLPLYQAVVHGCLAEEYDGADDIFVQRIWRKDEYYSENKLGAYSNDLIALAAFFPNGWSQIIRIAKSTENLQARLSREAGFCLMALGRLLESVEPMQASLNLSAKLQDSADLIWAVKNFVELCLLLGRLDDGLTHAQSMLIRNNDVFWKMRFHNYLAAIYHRQGNMQIALINFQDSEKLAQQSGRNYLVSLSGFYYCSYLLDCISDHACFLALEKRARYSLEISKKNDWLHTIALDYLILARMFTLENEFSQAEQNFTLAMQSIQKTNRIDFTPLFFLYRADFYLHQNQMENFIADLNSAWEIIERCGMKLYQIDYLLINGRYSLVIQDFDSALKHYEEAKILIKETGYHLRDAELNLFAALICQHKKQNLNFRDAEFYLDQAKSRIKETGQLSLIHSDRWAFNVLNC